MSIEYPPDGNSSIPLNFSESNEEDVNPPVNSSIKNYPPEISSNFDGDIPLDDEKEEIIESGSEKDINHNLDSEEELRNQLSGLKNKVQEIFSANELPLTTLEYDGHIFKMFPDKDSVENKNVQVVIEDKSLVHMEFNLFIAAIRVFLEKKYGVLPLSSKEIFIEFPDLNLQLNEDNIYVKRMTMDDIISIFNSLRINSIRRQEKDIPEIVRAVVVLRPRFVSRYNDLVEIMDNNGSFSTAQGFSNDKSHPVIVDETGSSLSHTRKTEIFVMDSDEASIHGVDSDIEILN